MTTLEGNKLIAEFMGCSGGEIYIANEPVYVYGFPDTHITDRWRESEFAEQTPYHSSWDWLMLAVEKIAALISELKKGMPLQSIQMIEMQTLGIMSRREDVYEKVVQFIQWYNSRTSNKTE